MKKTKKFISLLSVMAFLVMAFAPVASMAAEPTPATAISITNEPAGGADINPPSSDTIVRVFDTVTVTPADATVTGPDGAVTVDAGKFSPSKPGEYTITATGLTPLKLKVYWRVAGADQDVNSTLPMEGGWVSKFLTSVRTLNGTSLSSGFSPNQQAEAWAVSKTPFPASDVNVSNGEPLETADLWTFTQGTIIDATQKSASSNPIATWWNSACADTSRYLSAADAGDTIGPATTYTFTPNAAILDKWALTPGTWYVGCKLSGVNAVFGWQLNVAAPAATPEPERTVDFTPVEALVDQDLTLTAQVTPNAPSGAQYVWTVAPNDIGAAIAPGATSTATFTATQAGSVQVTVDVYTAGSNMPVCTVTKTVIVNEPDPDATPAPTPTPLPTLPPVTTSTSDAVVAPSVAPVTPSTAPSPSASASASASPSASASESAEPSESPSASPSTEPSTEPSTAPSSEPSESAAPPVEIKPDAPDAPADIEVVPNPEGEGSILTGVPIGTETTSTDVEAVTSWIEAPEGGTVKVLESNGEQEANLSAPVGTGMIIQVVDADGVVIQETTVVVKGDVLGTGVMSLTQLVRVAEAMTGQETLTGAYLDAADLNGDGEVTLTDLVLEARLYASSDLND